MRVPAFTGAARIHASTYSRHNLRNTGGYNVGSFALSPNVYSVLYDTSASQPHAKVTVFLLRTEPGPARPTLPVTSHKASAGQSQPFIFRPLSIVFLPLAPYRSVTKVLKHQHTRHKYTVKRQHRAWQLLRGQSHRPPSVGEYIVWGIFLLLGRRQDVGGGLPRKRVSEGRTDKEKHWPETDPADFFQSGDPAPRARPKDQSPRDQLYIHLLVVSCHAQTQIRCKSHILHRSCTARILRGKETANTADRQLCFLTASFRGQTLAALATLGDSGRFKLKRTYSEAKHHKHYWTSPSTVEG